MQTTSRPLSSPWKTSRIDWVNLPFLAFTHLAAIGAMVYLVMVAANPWTIGLALVWGALCGLAITGGYHRLFAHRAYRAHWTIRAFYLFFGAASVQNSALKWSSDHRRHHAHTDHDEDPYSISRGFWWAHLGWVIFKHGEDAPVARVHDLERDPLVRLQDRYYVPLAVFSGALAPMLLGFFWGDPIGALLVAGFLRLAVQWHATFAVNSVAHTLGTQPYSTQNSARDHFLTALVTMGEGYHNFHHSFQADYRNGVRWFHFDPTKWFVWSMSKIGLTSELRRTPQPAIEHAKQMVAQGQ